MTLFLGRYKKLFLISDRELITDLSKVPVKANLVNQGVLLAYLKEHMWWITHKIKKKGFKNRCITKAPESHH